MNERKFLFDYDFEGATYDFDIVASSPQEAKERLRKIAFARYQGEIFLAIPVPGPSFIGRIVRFFGARP